MPDHFHGILIIDSPARIVGTGRDLSLHGKVKSLSELIGAFKTRSSKHIHRAGLSEFRWQRSFYDHVIRTDEALEKIRDYIVSNDSKDITGAKRFVESLIEDNQKGMANLTSEMSIYGN